jgi:hypothetical protein
MGNKKRADEQHEEKPLKQDEECWFAIEWPELSGIEWYRKRPPVDGWQ